MQSPLLPQRPASLPSAPFLERFVLESPVLLSVILGACGLVVLFTLNRRGEAGKGFVGLGICLALAIGAWVAASLIETERERLKAATRDLIDSVAQVDLPRLEGRLAENAAFRYRLAPGGLTKPEILAEVERYLGGAYEVTEHSVLELQATVDSANVARTQVNVRVDIDAIGSPIASWWRLDWRLEPDGRWRVTDIEPLHPWLQVN